MLLPLPRLLCHLHTFSIYLYFSLSALLLTASLRYIWRGSGKLKSPLNYSPERHEYLPHLVMRGRLAGSERLQGSPADTANLWVLTGPRIFPIPDIYFTFLFPSFPCDLLVIQVATTTEVLECWPCRLSPLPTHFVRSSCADGLGGKGQIRNSRIEQNTLAEGNWFSRCKIWP